MASAENLRIIPEVNRRPGPSRGSSVHSPLRQQWRKVSKMLPHWEAGEMKLKSSFHVVLKPASSLRCTLNWVTGVCEDLISRTLDMQGKRGAGQESRWKRGCAPLPLEKGR